MIHILIDGKVVRQVLAKPSSTSGFSVECCAKAVSTIIPGNFQGVPAGHHLALSRGQAELKRGLDRELRHIDLGLRQLSDWDGIRHVVEVGVAQEDRVRPLDLSRNYSGRLEVLTWVARGQSASVIAKSLQITKRTVDEHVSNAARKLGAGNRTQAAVLALLRHMIEV